MIITGTRFGTITFDESRAITLPRGLIGFASEQRFAFLEPPPGRTVAWLQSITTPALAFPVVGGESFGPTYPQPTSIELGRRAGLGSADDPSRDRFAVLVVVASRGGPSKRIANLLAPIIINIDTRVGAQIVLDADVYSATTPFALQALAEASPPPLPDTPTETPAPRGVTQ